MYYPFKKQVKKIYNIDADLKLIDSTKLVLKRSLIIFFKVILAIIIFSILITIANFIRIKVLYSKLTFDEITYSSSLIIDKLELMIEQLNGLAEGSKWLFGGIINSIISILENTITTIKVTIGTISVILFLINFFKIAKLDLIGLLFL